MPLSATGKQQQFISSNSFFFDISHYVKLYLLVFHSQHDEGFVETEIINYLEGRGFKICWHQRDFRPGTIIAKNIANATEHSHRMIIILSKYTSNSDRMVWIGIG